MNSAPRFAASLGSWARRICQASEQASDVIHGDHILLDEQVHQTLNKSQGDIAGRIISGTGRDMIFAPGLVGIF
jgi:hypothetical protein